MIFISQKNYLFEYNLTQHTTRIFLVSDNLCHNFKSTDTSIIYPKVPYPVISQISQISQIISQISQSIISGRKIATFFLDIELTKIDRGYRKINSSILNDSDYTKMTKRVISDFLITNTQEYTSPHIFWETLKCVIRGETIKFSTQRKKNKINNNTCSSQN